MWFTLSKKYTSTCLILVWWELLNVSLKYEEGSMAVGLTGLWQLQNLEEKLIFNGEANLMVK